MRTLDQGSTTGAASGTVCEPRELTARRVRPIGPNQSLPHRHIQRKSLSYHSGFFAFICRDRDGSCASLTCPTHIRRNGVVGWVSVSAPTVYHASPPFIAQTGRQVRFAYLPYEHQAQRCCRVGKRQRTHHLPRQPTVTVPSHHIPAPYRRAPGVATGSATRSIAIGMLLYAGMPL